MANYSAKSAVHKTLVAATLDTVTLDADFQEVEVLNRSSTDTIYFCADGVGGPSSDGVPTVAGDNTEVAPPNSSATVRSRVGAVTVVKLISSGTPAYSVRGLVD